MRKAPRKSKTRTLKHEDVMERVGADEQAQRELRESPQERSRTGEQGVFFRTSAKRELDELRRAYSEEGFDNSRILTALISWAASLGPEEQRLVLRASRQGQTLVESVSDIVATLAEAEHAFQGKRWLRAEEAYAAFLPKVQAASRFAKWAHYKLGFIWIDIAYGRRDEALREGLAVRPEYASVSRQYALAIRCLDRSIYHSEMARESDPAPHTTVARFNEACCHSLLAQYHSELAMLGEQANPTSRELAKSHREQLVVRLNAESGPTESLKLDHRPAVEYYDALAAALPADPVANQVHREAKFALDALDWIYDLSPDDATTISWALDSTRKDLDLCFVREAAQFRNQFSDLVKRLQARGATVTKWCEARLSLAPPVGGSQTAATEQSK